MSESPAPAPTTIEAPGVESEPPKVEERDPREELIAARATCSPKQRKLLDMLAENDYQPWRAGAALGLSKRTISKFLRDAKFKAARALLDEVATDDLCITNRRLLAEYAYIAFADIRGAYDAAGKLRRPADWPTEIAAAVSAVEIEESADITTTSEDGKTVSREVRTVNKLRLHSKLDALKALANWKHLIVERHEVTGKNGEPLQGAPQSVLVVPGMVSEAMWTAAAERQQEHLAQREVAAATNASAGKQ